MIFTIVMVDNNSGTQHDVARIGNNLEDSSLVDAATTIFPVDYRAATGFLSYPFEYL